MPYGSSTKRKQKQNKKQKTQQKQKTKQITKLAYKSIFQTVISIFIYIFNRAKERINIVSVFRQRLIVYRFISRPLTKLTYRLLPNLTFYLNKDID
jgi:hypothetical protein